MTHQRRSPAGTPPLRTGSVTTACTWTHNRNETKLRKQSKICAKAHAGRYTSPAINSSGVRNTIIRTVNSLQHFTHGCIPGTFSCVHCKYVWENMRKFPKNEGCNPICKIIFPNRMRSLESHCFGERTIKLQYFRCISSNFSVHSEVFSVSEMRQGLLSFRSSLVCFTNEKKNHVQCFLFFF